MISEIFCSYKGAISKFNMLLDNNFLLQKEYVFIWFFGLIIYFVYFLEHFQY